MKITGTHAGIAIILLYFFAQSYVADAQVISDDEYCLALNVYHEARSENLAGKFAVSDVVLIRNDKQLRFQRHRRTLIPNRSLAPVNKFHPRKP